jgi:Zn-dependent M16 (insulinase) family peptidase
LEYIVSNSSISIDDVAGSILIIRGRRVILDRELAAIYGVETRVLNQSVRRNIERFPEDFMFQISREEAARLRSQTVILKPGRGRHVKFLPYAFTEHGAIQAANVLSSQRAVEMGIFVVRAFLRLREMIASNEELAKRIEAIERKLETHDQLMVGILNRIHELTQPLQTRAIGFTADFGSKP